MAVITNHLTETEEHERVTGNSTVQLAITDILVRNGQRASLPETEARKALITDLRQLVIITAEVKK